MIVILKTKNKNRFIIKALSVLLVIIMFVFYYLHMSNKFQENTTLLSEEPIQNIGTKTYNKSMTLEKIIYKESVVIVNLLEQRHIQSIKVVKDKLFLICDFNTDIEPLIIRYGVGAMIKHTQKNIKIAIDLRTIVENKYEVQ